VVAGQPVDVRCVTVGGNPPPMLDVYIDWLNITRLFDLRRSFELRRKTGSVDSGEDRDGDAGETTRGLRVMGVTTVRETRRFVARVRDHGLETHGTGPGDTTRYGRSQRPRPDAALSLVVIVV